MILNQWFPTFFTLFPLENFMNCRFPPPKNTSTFTSKYVLYDIKAQPMIVLHLSQSYIQGYFKNKLN